MSIHFECKGSGPGFGIEYVFAKAGDTIPPHIHDAELAHDVECIRGRIAVCYETEVWVLKPGEIAYIAWERLHWITALEGSSIVFHRFINGRPESYRDLPAGELSGTL